MLSAQSRHRDINPRTRVHGKISLSPDFANRHKNRTYVVGAALDGKERKP
jgi:hypothetical protein